MNNSPFSMGWLMAMFDLPVMTDKERYAKVEVMCSSPVNRSKSKG
jgi:hypothetical protein